MSKLVPEEQVENVMEPVVAGATSENIAWPPEEGTLVVSKAEHS